MVCFIGDCLQIGIEIGCWFYHLALTAATLAPIPEMMDASLAAAAAGA
jgi:hypothetical protein